MTENKEFKKQTEKITEKIGLSENMKKRILQWSKIKNIIPRTVLDIGAYEGYWSKGIKEIFPDCKPFMIEGNTDKKEILEKTNFPFEIALVSDKEKNVTFYKTKKFFSTGNSIYKENTTDFLEFYTVEKRTKTLSKIVEERKLENIDLIKIDVQGAEKDVILGALPIIRSCKGVILELSIINYNEGAPSYLEILNFMKQIGFKLYDILDVQYMPNLELIQFDGFFVPK